MKSKTTYRIICGIIFTLVMIPLSGQEKIIKKENLAADGRTVFSVDNKYGNIDIKDWEKPEIDIEVTLVLRDVPNADMKSISDYVDIDIKKVADTLFVSTNYDAAFFELIGSDGDGNENKFEVNYMIMLPANTQVKVQNNYGNIFISKLTSASRIDLKYGVLKINQLLAKDKSNMALINLAFSKGSIELCEWTKLVSKYSALKIQESKALIILSKYSKMEIENGSTVISDSKYDRFEIGDIDNLVVKADYSYYIVNTVTGKISLETSFTDTKVKSVPASFKSVSVMNEYGTIDIGIVPEASYRLKAYAKYAKIRYPDADIATNQLNHNEISMEGIIGTNPSPGSTVDIETHFGGVRLY